MNLKTYLFLLSSSLTLQSSAQFIEQFNSRPGIAGTQVKNHLQASCWNFSSFISSTRPPELIEGDGSLLSIPSLNSAIPSGIYSPILDMRSELSVMFKYRCLSKLSTNGTSIKIYLANAANEPRLLLDTLALDPENNSVFAYKKLFNHISPGPYKLFIQFVQPSSNCKLIVDDIEINANVHYAGGCNTAPVANDDMVSLDELGISKTSITSNDNDVDNDEFIPRIESGSADGIVKLNPDHSVAFKPHPGFKGSTTEFSYRICETAANGLCSESTKVTLNVPPAGPKTELLDFTGQYQQGGKIDLHWRTMAGHTNRKFDVERSLDGKAWQHAGTVPASSAEQYVFNDRVNKNTANKNDIYYRLKEVKSNDIVITSKLLVLRVYNSPGVRMVSVSPNPDKNDINVTLQLNQPAITSMKVVNSTGDEVFRKTVKTTGEVNNILLDGTSKLQPGEYTLDVIINSKERMFVPLMKE